MPDDVTKKNGSDEEKLPTGRSASDAEKDDFWDLEALLPRTRQRQDGRSRGWSAGARAFTSTQSTEISLEPSRPAPNSTDAEGSAVDSAANGRVRFIRREPVRGEGTLTRYVQPHTAAEAAPIPPPPEPERVYTRPGSLLHTVRVYPWKNGASYP